MNDGFERLGPYRLVSAPQYWGARQVFRAVHEETGEPAAVHLLGELRWTAREQAQQRFHARRGLRHPNLAQLRSEGLLDQRPWFATELHEGTLLSSWLDRAPASTMPISPRRVASDTLVSINAPAQSVRSPESVAVSSGGALSEGKLSQILTLAHEMCDVLTTMHAEGFVHGSLGPSSVLMRDIDGSPVLLDPGVLEPTPSNPPFPPELLDGELLGGRADVFLLGALLYELLAGQAPSLSPQPGLLWASARGVPTPLARLVQRMAASKPNLRPGHPSDCALELAMFLGPNAQLSRPRFTSALERAGSRPSQVLRASDVLFQEGARGLLLRTAPLVDVSSLLTAIGAQAQRRGLRVMRTSRCLWDLPLGAFSSQLGSLAGLDAPEEVEPAGARDRVLSAAEQALGGGSALLIVDGVDGIDELSLLLLARLQRRGDVRLLLSGLSLPAGLAPLPEIAVDPLDSAELDDLLRMTLATQRPPQGLSQALQACQQEDPWLIEQQLASLVERQLLARDEIGVWRLTAQSPTTTANLLPTPELLTERLERLEPLQKNLLAAAALLRAPAPPRWLLLLAGLSESDPMGLSALDALLRRRWLIQTAEDQVGLIASWLEAPAALMVDDDWRAVMHLRAARLLKAQGTLWARGRAAYHLRERGETREGSRLLGEAGELALRMGAPAAALRLLGEAHEDLLGSETPDADAARSLRLQAAAAAQLGQQDRARGLLSGALARLGYRLAPAGLREQFTAPAPPSSPAGCAELVRCAVLLVRIAPPSSPLERLRLARAASAAARALPSPPRGMVQLALPLHDLAARLPLGPIARRASDRVIEASIALDDRAFEAQSWASAGRRDLAAGRWARAEQELQRAAERAAALRAQPLALEALSSLALAFLLQGELARSLAVARSLPSQAQDEQAAPWLAVLAEAEVALRQGREQLAIQPLQRLIASPVDADLRARARGLLAFAQHRAGLRDAPDLARVAADELAPLLTDLRNAEACHSALDVLLETRCQSAGSRPAADRLLETLERIAAEAAVARPRLWQQRASLEASPRLLRTAAAEARKLRLPFSQAEALRRLAQHDQGPQAERDLQAAEAILTRLRGSKPAAFG